MPDIIVTDVVDARDLMCPMPMMAAAKAMRRLEPDQVLKVMATDRGALSDIPAWAGSSGHEVLSSGEEEGVFVFYVRRGGQE